MLYLTLDIEKKDAAYERGLFAVAFLLLDTDFNVLKHIKVSFRDVPWTDPDTEAFWKRPEQAAVLAQLEKEAVPWNQASAQILDFIDAIPRTYNGERVTVLSDNPAYDVAHLDVGLGINLRYRVRGGRYGPVEDVDGFWEGARCVLANSPLKAQLDVVRVKTETELARQVGLDPALAKHDPLFDVIQIASRFIAVKRVGEM